MRLFTIILLLITNISRAQNLAPNPGFEEYNYCPKNQQVFLNIRYALNADSPSSVKNWVSPILQNSPDYFNACNSDSIGNSTPYNISGYQTPRSGNGYVGIAVFYKTPFLTDYREYVEARLLSPLIEHHQYHISFHVSRTVPRTIWHTAILVDKIGAVLTRSLITDTTVPPYSFLTAIPTIVSAPGQFITDTTNWTKIEGIYTATGGEEYITIGRFTDGNPLLDSVAELVRGDSMGANLGSMSYIYMDDVCVQDITIAHTSSTRMCTVQMPVTITGTVAGENYEWNTGATTASILAGPGVYWRRTSGECLYFTDTIEVLPQPVVSLGPDTAVCNVPGILLGNSQSGVNYLWNTRDTTANINVTTSGQYYVLAGNACGEVTDTVNITVYDRCTEPCIWLPTAFTPNDDGHNDVFRCVTRCPVAEYRCTVYNRYGNIVWTTADVSATWGGASEDGGVYYYQVVYKIDLPGKREKKMIKGDVTLIR